jgi:hypothetical protein
MLVILICVLTAIVNFYGPGSPRPSPAHGLMNRVGQCTISPVTSCQGQGLGCGQSVAGRWALTSQGTETALTLGTTGKAGSCRFWRHAMRHIMIGNHAPPEYSTG